MRPDSLKLRADEDRRTVRAAAQLCRPSWRMAHRWATAALVGFGIVLGCVAPTRAAIPCLPVGEQLVKIPEIVSDPKTHVLKGTILLRDEQQRLINRSPGGAPGQPGTSFECVPQVVRAFRSAASPLPTGRTDPVPGPTLRARVGDIIQLTFINQVDANRFGASFDLGDKPPGQSGTGCDMTDPGNPSLGYPTAGKDTWPDCFHGSSTGNIHYHGTHTNPNGTGDNVFLQIRPSPRDGNNKPTMVADKVNAQFKDFFAECERRLRADPLTEWPTTWKDAPQLDGWFKEQENLLTKYQDRTGQNLWKLDQDALNAQPPQWPQFYIGAFPYCFTVPDYTAQRTKMGQAPGTHWYHAHKHGSTAIDVAHGMTGVFIIEGKYDDDLNAYYGKDWTRSQPVVVINQLGGNPNLVRTGGFGRQDKGPEFMVNGRFQPKIEMAPGEVQLLRIANTSGRSGAFFPGFPPGFQWKQLAQDGVQFTPENYDKSANPSFLLDPGNRIDLLVKAPPLGIYPVLVQHQVDPGDLPSASPVVLLFVHVGDKVAPAKENRLTFIPKERAPSFPSFLSDITGDEVGNKISKTITFKTYTDKAKKEYTMHTIDGHKFEDGDKPYTVDLNTAEEWKIVNESYGFRPANSRLVSHPFHIHLNPFQLVEVFDPNQTVTVSGVGAVPKYEFYQNPPQYAEQCYLDPNDSNTWKDCHNNESPNRIWWDVFPIPSGAVATDATGKPIMKDNKPVLVPGFFRMRSRFVDFPGSYVMHCHILAHEDRGMMAIVTVGPAPARLPMHH